MAQLCGREGNGEWVHRKNAWPFSTQQGRRGNGVPRIELKDPIRPVVLTGTTEAPGEHEWKGVKTYCSMDSIEAM